MAYDYVPVNGHIAACETGGYGAGSEPYEDLRAGHNIKCGIDTATVFGTTPITELTANTGKVDTHADDKNNREAHIDDGSLLV